MVKESLKVNLQGSLNRELLQKPEVGGLGLSLAKRIIEEYHLGKIKVLRSDIGKGTTFQITLRKSDAHV